MGGTYNILIPKLALAPHHIPNTVQDCIVTFNACTATAPHCLSSFVSNYQPFYFIYFISKIRNTYNENMIKQLVYIKTV